MQARDEYVQRVPPERDKQKHAAEYAFYSADQFYLYGHFKEAARRGSRPIYDASTAARDPYGYEAWKRLIVMSNLQNDAARSRASSPRPSRRTRARGPSCSRTRTSAGVSTTAILQNAAFEDANEVFEQAKAAPPGPEQDALWRKAGKMYEDALRAAPAHKDAPAAAINSAFCYKQVGEFNKAIELYQLFISNYGSEDILDRLERGGTDPETKAKVAPESGAVQGAHQVPGDGVRRAVDDVLRVLRLPAGGRVVRQDRHQHALRRRRGGRTRRAIAMVLYSNLGDRANMNRMYGILVDPQDAT